MKILLRAACLFSLSILCARATPAQPAAPLADLRPYANRTFALVRNTTRDAPTRIDLVLFDASGNEVRSRHPTRLDCERVHLGGQTIFCLGTPKAPGKGGPADFAVTDLALKHVFAGSVPNGVTVSRARVSGDAAYAASTVFVTGHAYGTATFSTEAVIIELGQKKLTLPPLEYWEVRQDNARVSARDLNLWGVTFHPKRPDEFYVTAAFAGKMFLAKGEISTRRIDIVRADIECPSFSPDGARLAFKKRIGNGWAPAVLELATMRETVFKESRSIDDQIEWLDEHTLLYELNTPGWFAPKTDLMQRDIRRPDAPARLWLANAASPAIARRSAK